MLETNTNGCLSQESNQAKKLNLSDTQNEKIDGNILNQPSQEDKTALAQSEGNGEEQNESDPFRLDMVKVKQDLTLRLNNNNNNSNNSNNNNNNNSNNSDKKITNTAKVKSFKSSNKTGSNQNDQGEDEASQKKVKSESSSESNQVKIKDLNSETKPRGVGRPTKRVAKNASTHQAGAGSNASGESAGQRVASSKNGTARGLENKNKKHKEYCEDVSNSLDEENEPRTSKRVRLQYQPFQSPDAVSMLSNTFYRPTPAAKGQEVKIVLFNKGDFLAVRNELGTFYVCRTAQNVYKSSRKFKIQWLNDDKEANIYIPDFYDQTDFECVLTNLKMIRLDKGKYQLPIEERKRTMNILERAINVEKGLSKVPDPRNVVMDGVDVSIVGKAEEKELINAQSSKPSSKSAIVKTEKTKTSTRLRSAHQTEEKETVQVEKKKSTEVNYKPTGRHSSRQAAEKDKSDERRSTRSTRNSDSSKAKLSSVSKKESSASSFSLSRKRRVSSSQSLSETKAEAKIPKSSEKLNSKGSASIKSISIPLNEAKKPKVRPTLIPNLNVTLYENDPTFDSKEEIPHISSPADSKLLIRAVNQLDYDHIEKLIKEEKLCSFCITRSVDVPRDAFSYALQKEDLTALKLLMNNENISKLTTFPDVLMCRNIGKKQSFMILGQLNKKADPETVESLIMDLSPLSYSYQCLRQRNFFNNESIQEMLRFGVSQKMIQQVMNIDCQKSSNISTLFLNNIVTAIKYGHKEIASFLIQEAIKKGGFGFHTLHRDSLRDKQELNIFNPSLVSKRALSNHNITPIHCAAINPDSYYLSTLLESHCDNYYIQDSEGWQPIHYAAVCTVSAPLKYIISKGISTLQKDNKHNTPLHLACLTGRVHNVELILSHEANNGGDKHGGSSIEKANKDGYTPLHVACLNGEDEIVKILLQSGADAEKVTISITDRLTPLMIAAQAGHLSIVKILIEKGVDVEVKDKKERTALIHSVINGHSNVVSFLLRLGANPDSCQSNGNTAVHFAVAYGWYFALRLLIEAKAKLNMPNACNITPMMIGYVKGHMGLVETLAKEGVTFDLQNNNEKLLFETLKTKPGSSMVERVRFLVENKIEVKKVDIEGNTAFHYLADYGMNLDGQSKPYLIESEEELCSEDEEVMIERQERKQETINTSKNEEGWRNHLSQVITLLLDFGCAYDSSNNMEETCYHKAAKHGYFDFFKSMLNSGVELNTSLDKEQNSLLHLIVKYSPQRYIDLLPYFEREAKNMDKLCLMAKLENNLKQTPLTLALLTYQSLKKEEQSKEVIVFLVDRLQSDLKESLIVDNEKKEICVDFAAKYCTHEIHDFLKTRSSLDKKDLALESSKQN